MKIFFRHAIKRDTFISALKASLVVGTIIGLTNHYDSILAGSLTKTEIFQILISYLIPYGTATYGGASHGRHLELSKR